MFLSLALLTVIIEQIVCQSTELVAINSDGNSTNVSTDQQDKIMSLLNVNNLLHLGNQYGPLIVSGIGLLFSLISIIMVNQVKNQIRKLLKVSQSEKLELKQLRNGHLSTISEAGYDLDEFDDQV